MVQVEIGTAQPGCANPGRALSYCVDVMVVMPYRMRSRCFDTSYSVEGGHADLFVGARRTGTFWPSCSVQCMSLCTVKPHQLLPFSSQFTTTAHLSFCRDILLFCFLSWSERDACAAMGLSDMDLRTACRRGSAERTGRAGLEREDGGRSDGAISFAS
jgi:hypothetical protein